MADLNSEPGTCDVCGRSMLSGERTRTYLTRDRDEREVCDLCVVRAESAGWVRRELAGAAIPERREGRGAVRRLLGRAREGAAGLGRSTSTAEAQPQAEAPSANGAPSPAPAPTPAPERRRLRVPKPERPRAEEPAPADEDGAPEPPPRRRSVPQKPERRVRRALELFNESEHPATVRSLIRSLGGPYVSAVAREDAPAEVRITVAWELSWYQYDVDLAAEGEAVRELGRGEEIDQLPASQQAWNAHAAEDGELRQGLIGSESEA